MGNAFTTLSLQDYKKKEYSDEEIEFAWKNKKTEFAKLKENDIRSKKKKNPSEKTLKRVEEMYDKFLSECDKSYNTLKTKESREKYILELKQEEIRKQEEYRIQNRKNEKVEQNKVEDVNTKSDSKLSRRVDTKYSELKEDYARLKEAYDILKKNMNVPQVTTQRFEIEKPVEEKNAIREIQYTPITHGEFVKTKRLNNSVVDSKIVKNAQEHYKEVMKRRENITRKADDKENSHDEEER